MNAIARYAIFREELKRLIGGKRSVFPPIKTHSLVKEKGRKTNYHEFNLLNKSWEAKRRDLNMDEYKSFVEVSLRAAACPMPLNVDVWDAKSCPYRCAYCVPSGTKIMMADGTTKVAERVYPGDLVMSQNVETNDIEIATVEEVLYRTAPTVIKIKTASSEVKATPEHPVFTKRGWVRADELTTDDEVMVW